MAREVKICDKVALTIPDAAQVFSIGEQKLKALVEANRGSKFCFYNGNRAMIIKSEFEKFLIRTDSI